MPKAMWTLNHRDQGRLVHPRMGVHIYDGRGRHILNDPTADRHFSLPA